MKKTSRSLFGQPELKPTNYNTSEPFTEVDLSTKSVLVIDNGLFVEWAVMLARTFGKVYYHCPNSVSFPKLNPSLIGYGMEGVILCNEMFAWDSDYNFDEIDLFIFPDVNFGGLQEYLIKLGKRVWGSRRGEDLELLRWQTKKWMAGNDLAVNPTTKIIGVSELRKYFSKHQDIYVKISKYRGMFETFHHEDIDTSETWLDEIGRKLGGFKEYCEFIVEEPIKTDVETGFDGYVVDGQYPKKQIVGFEIKDKAYVCKVSEPPRVVSEINEKFADIFTEYGYRGMYSNEIRVSKEADYMTDSCTRNPSPPSELTSEMIGNWAEIMWHGAMGNFIEPEYTCKYGAEIMLDSTWIDKNWMNIGFPSKFRRNVKLANACKIDDKYYCIPQEIELYKVCSAIGMGETLEEAIEQAKEVAESIKGYTLSSHCESLDEAEYVVEKAELLGIKF